MADVSVDVAVNVAVVAVPVDENQPKRLSASTRTTGPQEERKVNVPTYPLIRYVDLPEANKQDIVDFVGELIERYGKDPEEAAKTIKEKMDKNYNPNWHVIVGENFAFDVSYEPSNLLYIFHGYLATVIWKSD